MSHSAKLSPSVGIHSDSDSLQTQRKDSLVLVKSAGATAIAEGITVTGTFCGQGDIWVDGCVLGKTQLQGTMTVSESGVVKGPIIADVVYVAGHVEGNIAAKKSLWLGKSGSIKGDIVTGSFVIEDGGQFNGRSHMTKADAEPTVLY